MKRAQIILWAGLALLVITLVGLFIYSAEKAPSAPTPKSEMATITASDSFAPSTAPNATVPAKLVVQHAGPGPVIAPPQPAPTAVPVQAIVTREDKPYKPQFHSGHSERLLVALNRAVPIQLSWPDDTTHSGVFIQAIQGGRIDDGGNSKEFSLGPNKTISFDFTPTSGTGMYQVIARRGTIEEALEFWVPTGHPESEPPTIK